MLEQAITAGIPLVTTTTTDPAHVPAILRSLAGEKVAKLESGMEIKEGRVYYRINTLPTKPAVSDRSLKSSPEETIFHWMKANGCTLIWVNPKEKSGGTVAGPMWYDAGIMPTPRDLVFELLGSFGLSSENISEIEPALGGLTLKEIDWVIRFAQSDLKSTSRRAMAQVRNRYFPERRGMAPVDTKLKFYESDDKLEHWITDAQKFLQCSDFRLRPRGILFHGPPGTGKSMGAKRIASEMGLPLYRLAMESVKNKWVGNSEKFMTEALREIDREAPCVVLIDEVEKVFAAQNDHGTTSSLLASLLWWLQEHESPVLTVMTTNNLAKIPPELYRPGRIDKTLKMEGVSEDRAAEFIEGYAESFNTKLDPSVVKAMVTDLWHESEKVPHATICGVALEYIKVAYTPPKRKFTIRSKE